MEDWRLDKELEQEYDLHFKGMKFLHIIFPEFWQRAYETKNNFFKHVYAEAEEYVKELNTGAEYLTDELCYRWWDRHCSFCMKEITTDMHEECYCSEDGNYWICAECFNDFKERFEWQAIEKVLDIPEVIIKNTVGIIIAPDKNQ